MAGKPAEPERKVAVVGAGQMGIGIAHALATGGARVALVDLDAGLLAKAKDKIVAIVSDGVARGKSTPDAVTRVAAALHPSTDLAAAVRDAELVVETASERIDIKLDIIATVAGAVSANTVIATNTSALSITEIATADPRPERFVGLHFFNPVHKMKLIEIIRGLQTSDETLERARQWAEFMGKTSITVNEAPGFTTSRISALLGNEAMWMLSENVASAEDIDTSLRLAFNHPMGPLELGDLTGWDTRLSVLKYLNSVMGERFRPCPLIYKMVSAGRYGRKVGHGVYRYEDGVKVPGSGLRVSL